MKDFGSIVPPLGARIHIIRVTVNQDETWDEAINTAGPNTIDIYIRRVADLYPPLGVGIIEQNILLLNYPNGTGKWERALGWATEAGLSLTVPRQVFPITHYHPNLHRLFGLDPMCVAATTMRVFNDIRHTAYVWWGNENRGTGFDMTNTMGAGFDWFAFC